MDGLLFSAVSIPAEIEKRESFWWSWNKNNVCLLKFGFIITMINIGASHYSMNPSVRTLCWFSSSWGEASASFLSLITSLSLEILNEIIQFSPVQLCLSCNLFCQYLWSLLISSTEEECFRLHSTLLRKTISSVKDHHQRIKKTFFLHLFSSWLQLEPSSVDQLLSQGISKTIPVTGSPAASCRLKKP